jgi:hypothetical protein
MQIKASPEECKYSIGFYANLKDERTQKMGNV